MGSGVILVVCQESGSTPVLMDSWNKSVKTAHGSLAAYRKLNLTKVTYKQHYFFILSNLSIMKTVAVLNNSQCKTVPSFTGAPGLVEGV